MLKGALIFAAIVAPFAGGIAYDSSETRTEYYTGTGFLTGMPGVYERRIGRLGTVSNGELVGVYGGGSPRVIGFGCEGAEMPVIAMEESDLPACERVEPIINAPRVDWAE